MAQILFRTSCSTPSAFTSQPGSWDTDYYYWDTELNAYTSSTSFDTGGCSAYTEPDGAIIHEETLPDGRLRTVTMVNGYPQQVDTIQADCSGLAIISTTANASGVIINAVSPNGGLTYALRQTGSNNDFEYQPSNTFPRPASNGYYDISVKDQVGCTANTFIEIKDVSTGDCHLLSVSGRAIQDKIEVSGLVSALSDGTFPPVEVSLDGQTWEDFPLDAAGAGLYLFQGLSVGLWLPQIRELDPATLVPTGCSLSGVAVSIAFIPFIPSGLEDTLFYLLIDGARHQIKEPIGWNSAELALKRDRLRHGFVFEFADLKLQFECDNGRELIVPVYERDGVDSDIGFEVYEKGCSEQYLPAFLGKLDMESYERSFEDETVTVGIERRGYSDQLKTHFKTALPLAGNKSVDGSIITELLPSTISMHSKGITEDYEAGMTNPVLQKHEDGIFISSGGGDETEYRSQFVQFGFDNVIKSEIQQAYQAPSGFNPNKPGEIFEVARAGKYRLKFDLDFTFRLNTYNDRSGAFGTAAKPQGCSRGSGGARNFKSFLFLNINGQETKLDSVELVDQCGRWGHEFNRTQTYTVERDFAVGDRIGLYMWHEVGGVYNQVRNENSRVVVEMFLDIRETTKVTVSAVTETPPTIAKGFLWHDAFSYALARATGKDGGFYSAFLGRPGAFGRTYAAAGCGAFIAVTNGFALRQFPYLDRPFTVSLEDLANAGLAVMGLGLGVEREPAGEIVRVEPVEHFYKDVELMQFEDVEDYKEEVANDIIYSSVEVGYDKWETEGKNGLDEFAGKLEFTTPIKTVDKKLSLISKLSASGYMIEAVRRKPYSTDSTDDTRFDEQNFLVKCTNTAGNTNGLVSGYAAPNQIGLFGIIPPGMSIGSTLSLAGSDGNDGEYTVLNTTGYTDPIFGFVYSTIFVSPDLPNPNAGGGLHLVFAGALNLSSEKTEGFEVSGIVSPDTPYNVALSPKRNLLRNAPVLASALHFKPDTQEIKTQRIAGNANLSTTRKAANTCEYGDKAGLTIRDRDDELVGTLRANAGALWRPEYITCKVALSPEDFQDLKNAHIPELGTPNEPYGYLSIFNGSEFVKAWILELKYKQSDGKATLKLIKKAQQ